MAKSCIILGKFQLIRHVLHNSSLPLIDPYSLPPSTNSSYPQSHAFRYSLLAGKERVGAPVRQRRGAGV